MTRWLVTTCLAMAVAGVLVDVSRADEIALNYSKIKFEYVEQDPAGGITFGGGSTFPVLPADFFDPGSEPFGGNIPLTGSNILQNAVSVERTAGAIFGTSSSPQDIPSEVVALDLASIEPISVNFSDGSTQEWDLTVSLSMDENSSCWIRVAHNKPGESDGGTILPVDSVFDVFAEITFTHTPTSGERRYRSFAIIDRTHLTTTDAKWAHWHSSIASGADRDFIPGADPANPFAPLQVLFFDGGGLDLPLRVVDVVPEPSSLVLVALSVAGIVCGTRRRGD